MKIHTELKKACCIVGSQASLARNLKVKPPTVNQWIHLVKKIPIKHCVKIELLTKGEVKREDLNPNIDWSLLQSAKHIEQDQPSAEDAE